MQRNKIYVFSATGTCLQIAKDIAHNIEDVALISIPKLVRTGEWEISGDKVGFIFPCYYGDMPQLLFKFIRGAKHLDIGYAYAIAAAGRSIGYCLKQLDEELKERDSRLCYGKSMIVASNYMNGWYYEMFMPKPKELETRIIKAKALCENFARDISKKNNNIEKPSWPGYLLPKILSPKRYVQDTEKWDIEFSVADTCNGCGVCEKVCPINNISMESGKPVFGHHCQRCMGCIQYCPRSAFIIKNKRMNKTKYYHPNVKLQEMIRFNN